MLRKSSKRVLVLGAGPAGLLAAHAAWQQGYTDISIASAPDSVNSTEPRKSDLFGCQYLHRYIPDAGLVLGGQPVRYLLDGSRTAYRRKVYREQWRGETSVDEYGPEESHLAWDLRTAYDTLWGRWHDRIVPLEITPRMAEELAKDTRAVVLCTLPAPALCLDMENHKFASQGVWAMGSRGPEDEYLPYRAPDMTVQCNALDAPRWYRAATVFGYSTLEWPSGPKPPIRGIAAVNKPLSTDCTCHLSNRWHRLGRYGRWFKGVLTHTAYEWTFEALR